MYLDQINEYFNESLLPFLQAQPIAALLIAIACSALIAKRFM